MDAKSLRQKSAPRKPQKPHPDFPLTPHASGQWCKKIRGKIRYFGSEPDAALRKYLAEKDYYLAGIDPNEARVGETVGWLCNAFMDSRQSRLDAGEITKRSLDDYHATVKRLADYLGKGRMLRTLGPKDFSGLKDHYCSMWGPVTVGNEIGRVNVVLKYALDIEAVPRRINVGPDFRRPNKKTLRKHRKQRPAKMFGAGEIWALMNAADAHVRAMIHLGINCAYNNKDCGLLQRSWIDFDTGWLSRHRNKTGVDREAYLWPETIEALSESLEKRKEPRDPDHADLFFVTKYGGSWAKDTRNNPLSSRVRLLLVKLEIHRAGVNFGALRHTFETVAGNNRDQVAVNHVMGHADTSMASIYREGIDKQRVIDVCEHVRRWWLAGKPS